ncbi:MAG: S-layer homology domain-containing protein [Oscillospiraceae bacterium]|nr:S-layer homology domain-containing protein [Oscillospiraceae bacterium]
MRTLKKSLCLVLVVVMMFSLCAFGASADTSFSDASEIEYTQAVDMLTTLGVITGYEDGTFDPDGTLTRAEACAIIARLLKNDDLTGTSDFTDVSSDHWAVDYIAYCASEGIVAGYGDGTFGPDDTLTCYAWMKMLLCAAGYNAEEEGMVGTTWEIGVATLAKDQDVTDDVSGVSYGNAVSRDVACKLAFNMATKTTYVKWKTTSGGTNIVTSAGDASTTVTITESGEYHYYYTDKHRADFTEVDSLTAGSLDNYATFLEYVWNAYVDTNATDDFGRPAKKYTKIDDIDTDITVLDDDPVVTVTGRTNASSFASLLSGYKVHLATETTETNEDGDEETTWNVTSSTYAINNSTDYSNRYFAVDVFENGEQKYEVNKNSDGDIEEVVRRESLSDFAKSASSSKVDLSTSAGGQTLCEVLENLSANGKVIEFYESDDEANVIDTIVFISYTIGTVDTVKTSGNEVKYTVMAVGDEDSVSGTVDGDNPDESDAVVYGSVEEDDYVTYVIAYGNDDHDEMLYIYPTTSVEGTYTSYTTGNNGRVTVEGTTYTVGRGVIYNAGEDETIGLVVDDSQSDIFGSTNEEITLILDQYGYAVCIDEETSTNSTSSNYVFVHSVIDDSDDPDDTYYKLYCVTQEGVSATLYSDSSVLADYLETDGVWMRKSTNAGSDGYYDFYELTDSTTYVSVSGELNNSKLSSSQSTITDDGDLKANSSTVFLLRTVSSSGSITYRAYTGLSKVPSYTDLTGKTVAYGLKKSSSSYATAIYINFGTNLEDYKSTGSSDDEIIFLLKNSYGGSGYDSSTGDDYWTFDVIMDGAKTTVKGDSAGLAENALTNSSKSKGIVRFSYDASSDLYTNFEEVDYDNDDGDYGYYKLDSGTTLDYSGGVLSWEGNTTEYGDDSLTLSDDVEVYYIYGNSNTTEVGSSGSLLDGDLQADGYIWCVYKSTTNHTVTSIYFWSSKELD